MKHLAFASYFLYGILKELSQLTIEVIDSDALTKEILDIGSVGINYEVYKAAIKDYAEKYLKDNFKDILAKTFNTDKDMFSKTTFEFSYENEIFDLMSKDEIGTSDFEYVFRSFKGQEYKYTATKKDDTYFIMTNVSDGIVNQDGSEVQPSTIYARVNRHIMTIVENMFINRRKVMYIPAERIGINTFRKEIGDSRKESYDLLVNSENEGKKASKYPLPIADYIQFLFSIPDIQGSYKGRKNSFSTEIMELEDKVVKGIFEYDEVVDEYTYRRIYRKVSETNHYRKEKIPFYITSSSVKSLFGLDAFLERANRGDILIIDEPEMNLHPENQVEICKVLYELSKKGLHVIISTHSNYLIRKLLNFSLFDKDLFVNVFEFSQEQIKKYDLLAHHDYIENFDKVNLFLDEEYYSIIEERAADDLGGEI